MKIQTNTILLIIVAGLAFFLYWKYRKASQKQIEGNAGSLITDKEPPVDINLTEKKSARIIEYVGPVTRKIPTAKTSFGSTTRTISSNAMNTQ